MAVRRLEQESGLTRSRFTWARPTPIRASAAGARAWWRKRLRAGFSRRRESGLLIALWRRCENALDDLKPARFGHGQFTASQFIRNRLVGGLGKVDPEFSYAAGQAGHRQARGAGSLTALTQPFSRSDMMEFSADYPGCWERAVEQATGGMAVFLAGGVGSHSPVPGGRGLAGAEQMGQALARMLMEQLPQTPLTNAVTFGMLGLDVTMPPLNVRLSDGIRLRPWLAGKLVPARSHSFLQVFRIDDSVWISTPCDFSGELALGIKDFLRARGSSADRHQLQRGLCRLRDSLALLSPERIRAPADVLFRPERAGLLR